MKIVHTSDWHIGQNFYRYGREEEFRHFFCRLRNILQEETPDALIVAGDIFDVPSPSISAIRLYNEEMIKIAGENPGMCMAVIAGNHDSAGRLEMNGELWRAFNVNVSGTVSRENGKCDIDRFIVPVGDADKPVAAIALIPYISPFNIPGDGATLDERMYSLYRSVYERMSGLYGNCNIPLIATGHLSVSGMALNPEKNIGGIDSVDAGRFDVGFSYVALGHIHKAQAVGRANIRYSGSPLPLSFDEQHVHSVTVVSFDGKDVSEISVRPIEPLYRVVDIPEQPACFSEVSRLAEAVPEDERIYVRANVSITDRMEPDMYVRLEKCFAGKQARLCLVRPFFNAMSEYVGGNVVRTVSDFQNLSPLDVASVVFRNRYGGDMPDDVKDCFLQALRMAEKEKKEDEDK